MTAADDLDDLDDLPNLGAVLADELRAAGITTASRLRELGAKTAWAHVRQVNPERDCASALLALEGAIRGVRWMTIDPEERRRLSVYAAERRRP
jgi:DNA transformation protein